MAFCLAQCYQFWQEFIMVQAILPKKSGNTVLSSQIPISNKTILSLFRTHHEEKPQYN